MEELFLFFALAVRFFLSCRWLHWYELLDSFFRYCQAKFTFRNLTAGFETMMDLYNFQLVVIMKDVPDPVQLFFLLRLILIRMSLAELPSLKRVATKYCKLFTPSNYSAFIKGLLSFLPFGVYLTSAVLNAFPQLICPFSVCKSD